MNKIAVYPGTFDPVTNGHIDIIKRSMPLFDNLIIAVNNNSNPLKPCLFTAEERVEIM